MNLKTIVTKPWLFAPTTALLVALVVTTLFTTLDVVRNFSGVFSDPSGTSWDRVYETALSWFFPTFLLVLTVTLLGHLLFAGLAPKSNKAEQLDSDL